jgi:hypothetical protein
MATPNVDRELVKVIAADTNTPIETVSRMFEETWAKAHESWTTFRSLWRVACETIYGYGTKTCIERGCTRTASYP